MCVVVVVNDQIRYGDWAYFSDVDLLGRTVPISTNSRRLVDALQTDVPPDSSRDGDLGLHFEPDSKVPVCAELSSQCEDGVDSQNCVIRRGHDRGAVVDARERIVCAEHDLAAPVRASGNKQKVHGGPEVIGIAVVPLACHAVIPAFASITPWMFEVVQARSQR